MSRSIPIRIAIRVDFTDGSQHEYEVRSPEAVAGLPPGPMQGFWPEGVVTTDVAERMKRDSEREAVIKGLRQALWDIYAACGQDTDGDTEAPPPGVWTPDIDTLALAAVRSLRQDYDEALEVVP